MNGLLLVSGSDNDKILVDELVKNESFSQRSFVKTCADARSLISRNDYDMIIINAPLSDGFGDKLAVSAVSGSASAVILVVKNDIADEISAKVESAGVLVVPKPISYQMFSQAVKLASMSVMRMNSLKTENRQLQDKLEEMRLIDRAKCVLIQYLSMTEPQAHRYIEKQAMDLRVSKKDVALSLLKTYES